MNIVAIVQARMGSTRLPGKVMMEILGKSMLWHVVNRLKHSKLLNKIVVATSTSKKDDIIEDFCRKNNMEVFRGSEEDVLDRYYQAAKVYKADPVVRITADCPLIDPVIVDSVVKAHLDSGADYTKNISCPLGLSVEVFNYSVLEKAHKNAHAPEEREHVTVYFQRHPEVFQLHHVEAKGKFNRPDIHIIVDEMADLELVRKIFEAFKEKEIFFTEEVINLFEQSPELLKINCMVKQKTI